MPSSPESLAVANAWQPQEFGTPTELGLTTVTTVGDAAPLFEIATRAGIPASVLAPARAAAEAAGYASGWDAGMRAARVSAEGELRQARTQAEQLDSERRRRLDQAVFAVTQAAAVFEQRAVPAVDQLEDMIVASAFEIAEALVGMTLRDDALRGVAAIRRALSLVPTGEAITVAVNPIDYETLTAGRTPQLGQRADRAVQLVPDATLVPGDAIATSAATTIDARLSTALERVREVLAR